MNWSTAISTHPEDSERLLSELVNSYLFKDIYALEGLKKTKILDNLVKALAMQIGSEVSLNELSGLTGTDRKTVENYIDLEKQLKTTLTSWKKTMLCFLFRLSAETCATKLKKAEKFIFTISESAMRLWGIFAE